MNAVVIDTNVLLVANGSHLNVSVACRSECVTRLTARMKAGVVVIDDTYRILREYQTRRNPISPRVPATYSSSGCCKMPPIGSVCIGSHSPKTPPKSSWSFPTRRCSGISTPAIASSQPWPTHTRPNRQSGKPPTASGWRGGRNFQACGVKVEFLCPSDATGLRGEVS